MAKFEIKNRFSAEVIFSTDADSLRASVELAVKTSANLESANLWSANLCSANLESANLESANLESANLRSANLCSAKLRSANLRSADLRSANLCSAKLRSANLWSANLCSANLESADLRSADLRSADLRSADLRSANLTNAQLPAPTSVLLAAWGEVSAELCADLMMYDASCHPDQKAFDEWAKGGPCPYAGVNVQRACNFKEKKELWGKGKFRKPYSLMLRLFAEKGIKF